MLNNLLRNGYNVVAIHDYFMEKCDKYPAFIARKTTPRELAESVDVVISGKQMVANARLLCFQTIQNFRASQTPKRQGLF